jgi:hypothetical protein
VAEERLGELKAQLEDMRGQRDGWQGPGPEARLAGAAAREAALVVAVSGVNPTPKPYSCIRINC